jgi:hypothetical protein
MVSAIGSVSARWRRPRGLSCRASSATPSTTSRTGKGWRGRRLCRHRQVGDAGRRARGMGARGLSGARRGAVRDRGRESGGRIGHPVTHHRQPGA